VIADHLGIQDHGIDAYPAEVEVNSIWGGAVTVIVGLPDAAVKESRDRVTTALTNSGFKFPLCRSTINLAPADVKKEGPSFDLPIAAGMLAASDPIQERLETCLLFCHAPNQCHRFLRRMDTNSRFTATSIAQFMSMSATAVVKLCSTSKMRSNCASRVG